MYVRTSLRVAAIVAFAMQHVDDEKHSHSTEGRESERLLGGNVCETRWFNLVRELAEACRLDADLFVEATAGKFSAAEPIQAEETKLIDEMSAETKARRKEITRKLRENHQEWVKYMAMAPPSSPAPTPSPEPRLRGPPKQQQRPPLPIRPPPAAASASAPVRPPMATPRPHAYNGT